MNTVHPSAFSAFPTRPEMVYRGGQSDVSEREVRLPVYPSTSYFLLTRLEHSRYRLRHHGILLSMQLGEGGECIVYDKMGLNLYGVGRTQREAVDEYASMLVDLFEELVGSEDVLSCHLRQQLQVLRAHLTSR